MGPVLAQVLANADVAGYDGQVRLVRARAFARVLERPLRCCRYLTDVLSPALDVVPEPSIDFVLVRAHAPLKPHQLVFQAETQSTASPKEAEREAPQGAALVRLPHRSACVSNFHSFSRFHRYASWATEPHMSPVHPLVRPNLCSCSVLPMGIHLHHRTLIERTRWSHIGLLICGPNHPSFPCLPSPILQ